MKIVAVYLLFISASSGHIFIYPVYFRKASPERLFFRLSYPRHKKLVSGRIVSKINLVLMCKNDKMF